MAQHVVFLVHGMGEYADNWAESYIQQLETAWDSFPKLAASWPRLTSVKFVPINYAKIFTEYQKRLSDQNKTVLQHIAALPGGNRLDVTKLTSITGKLTGAAFGATHLLDVAYFHTNSEFRGAVANLVNAEITKHAPPGNVAYQFSVIAHSLGTAVIQRVLHARAQEDFKAGLKAPSFRVRCLLMLANVSRLLEGGGSSDVYSSFVRPSAIPSKGVCEHYLNGRNSLDPIWWPKEFDPAGQWIWEGDTKVQRFQHLSFTHLVSKNPHELADYLAHPLIHGTFFQRVTGPTFVSDAAIRERIAKHELQLPENLLAIAKQLGGLEFTNHIDSLMDLIQKVDAIVDQ